jgi:hypothetical protein
VIVALAILVSTGCACLAGNEKADAKESAVQQTAQTQAGATTSGAEDLPGAEKRPAVDSLNGKAFMLEEMSRGGPDVLPFLFSLHKVDGQWSAICGRSGSGVLWVTKIIYPCEVNETGNLLRFQHFPGRHSSTELPKKEIVVRADAGEDPKVYVDGIRVHASFFAEGQKAIFRVDSRAAAIRAANLALGRKEPNEPADIRETDSEWIMTFDQGPQEGGPSKPGMIVNVHKETGVVKTLLLRDDATKAPVEEDVAFFEKKYGRKITGVKPKSEYDDPDKFYSVIGEQLGIPEIAWKAAAEKYGWKKDDGKLTFTILKGGPKSAGGQGTWDFMFIRSAVNPETKKPDPATMEQVMVQIDYDGKIKRLERKSKELNRNMTPFVRELEKKHEVVK